MGKESERAARRSMQGATAPTTSVCDSPATGSPKDDDRPGHRTSPGHGSPPAAPASVSPRQPFRRTLTSPPSPAAMTLRQLQKASTASAHPASISKNSPGSGGKRDFSSSTSPSSSGPSPSKVANALSKGPGSNPVSTAESVELAMCRLASQHHLSDYNIMKRTGSQPSFSSHAFNPFVQALFPSGDLTNPLPTLPPTARQSPSSAPANGSAVLQPPAILSSRTATSSSQDDTAQDAAHTLLSIGKASPEPHAMPQHQHSVESNTHTATLPSSKVAPAAGGVADSAQQLNALSTHDSSLYRSTTQGDGPVPDRLLQDGRAAAPLLSSVSLGTPTPSLTMSASSTSHSEHSHPLDYNGDVRMRADSPGPATPPDAASLSPALRSNVQMKRDDEVLNDGQSLSPVTKKTDLDRIVERELSIQLDDAMGANVTSVLTTTTTTTTPVQVDVQTYEQGSSAHHYVESRTDTHLQYRTPSQQQTSPSSSVAVLQASTSIRSVTSSNFSGSVSSSFSSDVDMSHPALHGVKTSLTHPMNVSPLIPPELLPLFGQLLLNAPAHEHAHAPHLAHPTVGCQDEILPPGTPFVLRPSADIHALVGPNASATLFNLSLPVSQSLAMSSLSSARHTRASESTDHLSTSGDTCQDEGPVRLGNLVLSSCPGKKVRLSDTHLTILGIPEVCRPGGGRAGEAVADPRSMPGAAVVAAVQTSRSPICRDIKLDFLRAQREADVRAVVCCIDDEELRFLGAAWEEYSRVANEVGLEVIRLPMAEGYAPSSPDELDAHLAHLIKTYTLQGQNVLVHCRGGVGRAGLFACSWLIKLGLLGPIKGIHDPEENSLDEEMKVVVKVIDVIRKRRSAKAIETPQQVHFILQYIHWLSRHAQEVTAERILHDLRLQA